MEDIWFDIAAVGKNTLGDKMKILSLKNNLSAVYINHSLRATTITRNSLSNANHRLLRIIVTFLVSCRSVESLQKGA
jgi:hypothetical protein